MGPTQNIQKRHVFFAYTDGGRGRGRGHGAATVRWRWRWSVRSLRTTVVFTFSFEHDAFHSPINRVYVISLKTKTGEVFPCGSAHMQMSNSEEKATMGADAVDSKIQKQKECLENCTLLYQFASNDLHKFAILQQVFGACNVVKLTQDLPSEQRAEAIDSMFYEANARLEDPAFGCTGKIQQLQHRVSDLQSQITATQAVIRKIRSQQAALVASMAGFKTADEDGDKFNPASSASLKDEYDDQGDD